MSRIEILLNALLSGSTDVPEPQSRVEELLYALIQNGGTGGGGGGVSSWNDLTDRPFGVEMVTVNPYFDGDLTGRTIIKFREGAYCVKITDYTPSEAECIGATIDMKMYSANPKFDVIGAMDASTQFYGLPSFMPVVEGAAGSFVVIVTETATVQGIEVTAGTYFMVMEEDGAPVTYPAYFSALDVGTVEIVRKVPREYMPELPKIDLVSMGMPAVGIDDAQSINHGAETLIELMEKGTFQYTTLFEIAPGVSLPVTTTVNSFCAKDAGLYQASSLAYFEGTPLLIILNANAEDGSVQVQTEPLI